MSSISPSDWLNIILAMVGMFAGALFSWLFFRAQQKTDFNKLIQMLGEIDKNMSLLKDTDRLSQKIDLIKDLASLRSSVEGLHQSVTGMSATILAEVRGQLDILMRKVSEQFDKQIENSRNVLLGSVDKELKRSIPSPSEREALSVKIVDLVNNVLHTMGEYQRIALVTTHGVSRSKRCHNSRYLNSLNPVTERE